MTAPTSPDGTPPYPTSPPPVPGAPPPPRRLDLQGWSAVVTALVGVATLGAGFAGGYLTQSQAAPDGGPRPTATVTATVTVTATAPGAARSTAPSATAPAVDALPSGAPTGPATSAVRVLLASPDTGRGGTRTVLTGQGFPPDTVVRVSFVVKTDGLEYQHRDLRDTKSDADGAFSVEVSVPSDLKDYQGKNTYLRAQPGTGSSSTKYSDTVFNLLP
ncbi:hypothetical protein HUT16_08595 [Kitasatospora sp. NA04385]|uniref:hypothetical protein n=1 Tax=Kitasatospora sp. NA04385 TaxID=2742135 RepID=UPI00158FA41D|nr:hypothetical protein [Kitasatospora sp. NA04385]QKW19113.1 hypothetical protein HUT16_08595 [Kitasatospora sp. NA04385]